MTKAWFLSGIIGSSTAYLNVTVELICSFFRDNIQNEEERFIVPDNSLFLIPLPSPSQVDSLSVVLRDSLLVSQSPH
jgi:hypothetical protein